MLTFLTARAMRNEWIQAQNRRIMREYARALLASGTYGFPPRKEKEENK